MPKIKLTENQSKMLAWMYLHSHAIEQGHYWHDSSGHWHAYKYPPRLARILDRTRFFQVQG